MVKNLWIVLVLIIVGCSDVFTFDKFSNDEGKSKNDFLVDSEKCKREKDKYSNKIQGREFGFEGQDTGYLGCMRLKGWSKKPIKKKTKLSFI